jgi:tRNA A-37 threonylcarbamoyl transferase component Bud32
MVCPEASVLENFLAGALAAGDRDAFELHLDGCDDCRRTVALLAPGLTRAEMIPENEALAETLPNDEQPNDREPGSAVGRYVLRHRIGAGGMGVVYAADDPELAREVAIKLLRADRLSSQPDARDRIIREARAMARVSHPNVITVFDAGSVGEQVFIAMELVRGQSLRAWMADEHRTTADIVDTFVKAGRGLAAAHDAGLVHRDFKPDNVLCGDDGRVQVTDFGLALASEVATPAPSDRSVTATRIAGTPAYMAPEQHVAGHVDQRSDQFSFAASLYEALHGQRPFRGDSYDELSANVVAGRIAPPPAATRVPRSLRAILLRALSVRPGDRFPTMDELLRALGRDRARTPRRLAIAALVLIGLIALSLGADRIARERAAAVTRTSFAAARAQLGRQVNRRVETFVAMASQFAVTPIMREVATAVDQADFGLGTASDDRARLEYVHQNLSSADWVSWMRVIEGTDLAIADYKGRLLYASADPDRWGTDVTRVPALAAAYHGGETLTRAVVVTAGDPDVVASGLLGRVPRTGLQVLLARPALVGDAPRALFVQAIPGARLLEDVSLGEGTRMSLVAPGGATDGSVPPAILAAAPDDPLAIDEVTRDGETWLVQRFPLDLSEQDGEPPSIVLARRLDVGLAGLFPGARPLLVAAGTLLAALAALFWVIARRRDLGRRSVGSHH